MQHDQGLPNAEAVDAMNIPLAHRAELPTTELGKVKGDPTAGPRRGNVPATRIRPRKTPNPILKPKTPCDASSEWQTR